MRKLGERFYKGRLCPRHPYSGGLRYVSTCNCVACTRDRAIKRHNDRLAADHGFNDTVLRQLQAMGWPCGQTGALNEQD